MAALADYPVVVTGLTERGWEVAEAAGDRRDAGPGGLARVLYLTTNSRLDLRTEDEVSAVQQHVRGARDRDLLDISYRPAATAQALLNGLNDVRPHVVHFSGHAGGKALLFQG